MTRWPALLVLLVVSCTKPAEQRELPPGEPSHRDEPEHIAPPKSVHLSADVIKAAEIRTTPVKRERLVPTLSLPGEVVPDPDRSARISSPIAGRIDRVLFKEGARVKKGDALVLVRVPELGRVRAERATAQARAKAANANAKRLRALLDKGLTSEQELLDAEADVRAFEAKARGLSADLAAVGSGGGASLTLRAPVSGAVLTRNAVVGQPVTANEVLGSIADLSEVWFLGRVFEKDLGKVRAETKAEVELNAFPDQRFAGELEYVGKQVDPVARTLTARVRLKNHDELLRVGLFGVARVETETGKERAAELVVPRSAVTEVHGKKVVFVRQADNHFELHEVVLGDGSLGRVEVRAGLREGEVVVSAGVFSVKSALLKDSFAEEE